MPQYLDRSAVRVVNGAKDQMVRLLDLPWDHIFFTGSGNVGRIVAAAAAKHLCPTTLELGGKSPAIVLGDANIKTTARRILWGKQLNAAQTCIAPDYVLCAKAVQPQLVEAFRDALREFYPDGTPPAQSDALCNMVSQSAYGRLDKALAESKGEVVIGGEHNEATRQLDLTVVAGVKRDDSLMQQELFGPILPIVTCESKEEACRIINAGDIPLALYCFTKSTKDKDYSASRSSRRSRRAHFEAVFSHTRSGGFVHNDTLIHFAVPGLPFGGAGPSGYGN